MFYVSITFFLNRAVYESMWGKKCRVGHAKEFALYAGYLRLQIHTQNMKY